MTVKELMTKAALRNRLSDSIESGYDDDELIAYFNDAIDFVWHVLIDNNYYEVIGDITFTQKETPTPSDWYKATNQAPLLLKNKGKTIECYGELPYTVRYYRRPQFVSTVNDELPWTNEAFSNILAQLTIVFAMSNHEFDMTVEQDFVEAIINYLQEDKWINKITYRLP